MPTENCTAIFLDPQPSQTRPAHAASALLVPRGWAGRVGGAGREVSSRGRRRTALSPPTPRRAASAGSPGLHSSGRRRGSRAGWRRFRGRAGAAALRLSSQGGRGRAARRGCPTFPRSAPSRRSPSAGPRGWPGLSQSWALRPRCCPATPAPLPR